jgi:hypothetical protein
VHKGLGCIDLPKARSIDVNASAILSAGPIPQKVIHSTTNQKQGMMETLGAHLSALFETLL